MGNPGATATRREEAGSAVETKRQLIDRVRWRVRAGTPWRDAPNLWVLAGGVRAVSLPATRRGVSGGPGSVTGPRRRSRVDHLGWQRRLNHHRRRVDCDFALRPAPIALSASPCRYRHQTRHGTTFSSSDNGCAYDQRSGSLTVSAFLDQVGQAFDRSILLLQKAHPPATRRTATYRSIDPSWAPAE